MSLKYLGGDEETKFGGKEDTRFPEALRQKIPKAVENVDEIGFLKTLRERI